MANAIDWKTTALEAGWEAGTDDKGRDTLFHPGLDFTCDHDDWEGAARKLGIGPEPDLYYEQLVFFPENNYEVAESLTPDQVAENWLAKRMARNGLGF